MTTMTQMTNQLLHYPVLKEMSKGDVIFERGTLEKVGESKMGQPLYIFETGVERETKYGKTTKVGISAGQVNKALETEPMGNDYKIIYDGSKKIANGQWAGKDSHLFDITRYDDDKPATNSVAPEASEAKVSTQAVASEAPSDTSDSLDDLLN